MLKCLCKGNILGLIRNGVEAYVYVVCVHLNAKQTDRNEQWQTLDADERNLLNFRLLLTTNAGV